MVRKRGEKQYMTAYALNEWDSKLAGAVEWRQKIDSQRGAVLATELKNNSAKLAKWTAQSIIAGADQVSLASILLILPVLGLTLRSMKELVLYYMMSAVRFGNKCRVCVLTFIVAVYK
jgi:Eukaryotic translation initiation factor 3 subunit 7 (eIF-3)